MKNLSTTQKALIGVALAAGGYLAYKKFAGGSAALPPAGSSATQPGQPALPNDDRLNDPEVRKNYITLKNAYDNNLPNTVINNAGQEVTAPNTRIWADKTAQEKGITVQELLIRRAWWQGGSDRNKLISGLGNYNVADMLG